MGATVVGMSHNDNKKETAKELGCDDFINTHNESDLARYRKKLTHILCTGTGKDFKCKPCRFFILFYIPSIYSHRYI